MAIIQALQAIVKLLIQLGIVSFVGYTLLQHGPELSETAAQTIKQFAQAAGNAAEGAGDAAKDVGSMGGGLLLVAAAAMILLVGRR